MTRLVLIAAVYVGCASGRLYEPKPRQDEAAYRIVQSFDPGSRWDAPPVFWRESDTLNCRLIAGPNGTTLEVDAAPPIATSWWHDRGGCVDGVHKAPGLLDASQWIEAVWWGLFSKTPMAHEICHAWDLHVGGNGDEAHAGPCFAPGGLVDVANATLAVDGL